MSAIAGVVRLDGVSLDPVWLERMQNVLEPCGRDAQHLWHDPQAGLLRTLCRITPEDNLDRQPLHDQAGRLVLVFDGRIDNRDELADALDISTAEARLLADSAFVLKSYERWGDACLDHLLGDFALAVWDRKARRLFLARDPLGCRPLYWYRNSRFFAFASMSKGLLVLPEVPRALCEERLAHYLAQIPMDGPESFYKDIYRIEPGHVLLLENGEVHIRRYHRFDPGYRITFKNEDDYVEAARELLRKSVKCRLRSSGKVASHLSSGLDSSTVTATAAQLLQEEGKSLLAFTAVPREGFDGPGFPGRHADEGPAAAALAGRFPNIEHIPFRTGGKSPLDGLQERLERSDGVPPIGGNWVWLDGIEVEAARRGAKVLLTGQMGNMTISYNGWPRVQALLRQGRWLEWLQEGSAQVRCNNMRWRGYVLKSVAPFLPAFLWQELKERKAPGRRILYDRSAIAPDLVHRTGLYGRVRRQGRGWCVIRRPGNGRDIVHRPRADGWDIRTTRFDRYEPGDSVQASVSANGLETRDPTYDLRLVRFCLAIPEDQYLKDGRTKRLLHRLMGHILPPEILHAKTRGFQYADWHEGITAARDEIGIWLGRIETSPQAARYLDLARLRRLFENWPRDGWDRWDIIRNYYRTILLSGLAVGAFIHHFEGGNR